MEVLKIILLLKERGIIKALDANSFTRVHHEENEIKVMQSLKRLMPFIVVSVILAYMIRFYLNFIS